MLMHRYWTGPDRPELDPGTFNWTDDDLPDELYDWLHERMQLVPTRFYHHRANMVRWWLLYEHGGIWLDYDVTSLAVFPDEPFTAFHHSNIPGLDPRCVRAMGFPRHHPVPAVALTRLDEMHKGRSSISVSGDGLLQFAIVESGAELAMWEE